MLKNNDPHSSDTVTLTHTTSSNYLFSGHVTFCHEAGVTCHGACQLLLQSLPCLCQYPGDGPHRVMLTTDTSPSSLVITLTTPPSSLSLHCQCGLKLFYRGLSVSSMFVLEDPCLVCLSEWWRVPSKSFVVPGLPTKQPPWSQVWPRQGVKCSQVTLTSPPVPLLASLFLQANWEVKGIGVYISTCLFQ